LCRAAANEDEARELDAALDGLVNCGDITAEQAETAKRWIRQEGGKK
jgi:hypothetical protein